MLWAPCVAAVQLNSTYVITCGSSVRTIASDQTAAMTVWKLNKKISYFVYKKSVGMSNLEFILLT